jgi:Flp pilus assembly protein TadD
MGSHKKLQTSTKTPWEVLMSKGRVGSLAGTIICGSLVILATSGCSTTKNLLGYLKFWDLKNSSSQAGIEGSNTEKAIASFSKQVRPVRGNADSHYRLALFYQQRGRHREAIDELNKTVLIDPEYFKAYNAMGVSYDNLREMDRARQAYQKAINLAPKEDFIYNNLGYSYILSADFETAKEVLIKGLELDPHNDQLHNNLAMAHAGMENYDHALKELNQTSSPAGALLTLGRIVKEGGHPSQAEPFFEAAAAIDPSLEQKVVQGDRSVAKVSGVLGKEQTVNMLLRREINPPARVKAALKNFAPSRKANHPKLQPEVRPNTDLEPNFLVNKVVRVSTKGYQNEPQRKVEEPVSSLTRQFFPGGGVKTDLLTRTRQWL